MSKDAFMDTVDLEKIRVFYYVALEGSLVKAALVLNLSPPSISKHIADLEKQLNTKLFIRRRSGIQLTSDGSDLFDAAHRSIKDLEESCHQICQQAHPMGSRDVLKIVTTTGVTLFWLIEKLESFIDLHPHLVIRIQTTDQDVDFFESDADVGILPRVVNPKGLTFRKIKIFDHRLFASKKYLQRMGVPKTPEDLENHRLLGFYHKTTGHRGDADWHLRLTEKRKQPALIINNAVGQLEAGRKGYGIITFPRDFPYLQNSEMVEVLPDAYKKEIPVYFIAHAAQRESPLLQQLLGCLREGED
jgi:DNA-binding transcriptional LysR family regulator